MVKAIEPNAPTGASRMIQRMSVNRTVEDFSMPRAMLGPASPPACRPRPMRADASSTARIWLPVRALTRVAGTMAGRKSAKPSSWAVAASGGRPLSDRAEASTCRPLPGWTTLTTLTTTRPTTMATVVSTSK